MTKTEVEAIIRMESQRRRLPSLPVLKISRHPSPATTMLKITFKSWNKTKLTLIIRIVLPRTKRKRQNRRKKSLPRMSLNKKRRKK